MHLRTILVLGRVSNLPTVWSNVLAAALVAGVDVKAPGVWLMAAAASLLYTGGMYLNDWADAPSDREAKSSRPIPRGQASRAPVGWLAGLQLALGFAGMLASGASLTGSILLLALIVAYNLTHRAFAGSVVLMGGCRAALWFCGASLAGGAGVIRHPAILTGVLAVGVYFTIVSCLARGEDRPGKRRFPIPSLLAGGIVLDMILVRFLKPEILTAQTILVFAAFFVLTRVQQRYVPAT